MICTKYTRLERKYCDRELMDIFSFIRKPLFQVIVSQNFKLYCIKLSVFKFFRERRELHGAQGRHRVWRRQLRRRLGTDSDERRSGNADGQFVRSWRLLAVRFAVQQAAQWVILFVYNSIRNIWLDKCREQGQRSKWERIRAMTSPNFNKIVFIPFWPPTRTA